VVAVQLAWLLPPEGTVFFWNPQEGPSGHGCYFHPPFSLNTPPFCVFLLISFRNVAELYGLRNDACFEGSDGSKQGSRTDRKYSQTKLGYDITVPKTQETLREAQTN